MEIRTIESFLDYFEKVRKRTLRVAKFIPKDQMEWTYKEGKFTLGDMLRHLATIERFMYAESARFKPSRYPGCKADIVSGYDNIFAYMDAMHQESVEIFSHVTPEDLQKKTTTPAGIPITLWKWLRLMAEHEIHHRGQIYTYLGMMGIEVPPLYGLTAEEVEERSKPK